MDEFTSILKWENKRQQNCHPDLKLQTHVHKANYLQWSTIRKRKWENLKKN